MSYHLLINHVLGGNCNFSEDGHHITFITSHIAHLGTMGIKAPGRGILGHRFAYFKPALGGAVCMCMCTETFKGKGRQ